MLLTFILLLIHTELKELEVDDSVVSEAVNKLPDKSALADLLFESKCSWYSTSYRLVESVLSIFELLKLVDYFVQEGLIPFPKNVLDSSRDPKPFLIEALFKEEISMSKTIDAAQVKEGMESSFDINKFLDGQPVPPGYSLKPIQDDKN